MSQTIFKLLCATATVAAISTGVTATNPVAGTGPTVDRVDLIEVNRVYNAEGDCRLEQVIYWEWVPARDRFAAPRHRVVDWRMLRSRDQIPRRDWEHGGYVSSWIDHSGHHREVRAPFRTFSWTHHDPEMKDRNAWPKRLRRRLSDS